MNKRKRRTTDQSCVSGKINLAQHSELSGVERLAELHLRQEPVQTGKRKGRPELELQLQTWKQRDCEHDITQANLAPLGNQVYLKESEEGAAG